MAALALVLTAAAPAAASAAVRYAAPNGVNSGSCDVAAKCTLERAIEHAANNDEVVVTGGTYNVTTQIGFAFDPPTLNVHGDGMGAAAPKLVFSGSGSLSVVGSAQSVLSDIRAEGGGLTTIGTLQRVNVQTGGGGTACAALNVLDSVCYSPSGRGVTVNLGNGLVRNVTAFGGQYGFVSETSSPGPANVEIVNTIARGGTADLFVHGTSGGFEADVAVRYSNFRPAEVDESGTGSTITFGVGNQSSDPALVNPGLGDFHQTPPSPTRDAGEGAIGLDFEGQPRQLGRATDIGADEMTAAPDAATLAASEITGSAATLHGVIGPGGEPTLYRFEYGVSPILNRSTPDGTTGATPTGEAVSARVEGLEADTTYSFRATGANTIGSASGATLTFTTSNDDREPPLLGSVRLTRRSFAVGRRFTPLTAAKRGTTLSFRASERGTAVIAVQRPRPGRRRAGRCVAPGRARPGARRCTRWTSSFSLDRAVSTGTTRVPFTGRVGSRRLSRVLRPGRYRFRITARDRAGNRSDPEVIAFRVVRG